MILHDNGFEVETLAASVYEHDWLWSVRVRFPRIVLSELNTHRSHSKNSSSSRAVPIEKMLERVMNDPAMPVRFGGNKPGMQDNGQEHDALVVIPKVLWEAFETWKNFAPTDAQNNEHGEFVSTARTFWRFMAWVNSLGSRSYSDAGYHKQIANRLTEPFQHMNTILSATSKGWQNFFHLRDHDAADPTIAKLAGMLHQEQKTTQFQFLNPGD